MNALQTKYGEKNFKVVAVNLDANADDWKKFLESVPAHFDIALDPKGLIAKQFGVKGMPTSLIIDRDGKRVRKTADECTSTFRTAVA